MSVRNMVSRAVFGFGNRVFKQEELRAAWQKIKNPDVVLNSYTQHAAHLCLRTARGLGVLNNFHRDFVRSIPMASPQHGSRTDFDIDYLNVKLNKIYDLPEVKVDAERPRTINVLVPAFDFRSISAGFFGVFQVARFLRTTGLNVRLVMFDKFYFDLDEFRKRFLGYPGMENLFDELEFEYIGDRDAPLLISENDTCVATVWYSAYFARKIMAEIGGGKFLYLIQDYETNFHPGGSLFALADQSYYFNYVALFSTEALKNFFISNNIGSIRDRKLPAVHFNNACASNLPSRPTFEQINEGKPKKRIIFYSRPIVDRNMFELTALALVTAYTNGIFDPDEWECIGMGLGEGTVVLGPGCRSVSLPRMTLAEYTNAISGFDICLTLMASPHPSLIPMDLAGSGAIVVTNTFAGKSSDYLTSLSDNIIPCSPDLDALVEGLRLAKERSVDLKARYDNAAKMQYPRDWNESLTTEHTQFVKEYLLR